MKIIKISLFFFVFMILISVSWFLFFQKDGYNGLAVSKNLEVPKYEAYNELSEPFQISGKVISVRVADLHLSSDQITEESAKRVAADYLEKVQSHSDFVKLNVSNQKGEDSYIVIKVNTDKARYLLSTDDLELFSADQLDGSKGFPQFGFKKKM